MAATVHAGLCAALVVAGMLPGQQLSDWMPKAPEVGKLGLYRAMLPSPRIATIRSDAEATAIAVAAWGEDKAELHVDFDVAQIVAVCWGPQRRGLRFEHGPLDLRLETARVDGDVLRITVRTLIPLGPDGDLGDDEPGRIWYPCLFLCAPRTERVEVDVVGARCRDRERDFQSVPEGDLRVRVAPDSMPQREDLRLVSTKERLLDVRTVPWVRLAPGEERQVLQLDWGRLGPASYSLEVTDALFHDGVARVTVRADVRYPAFYSGPPDWNPRLSVDMPKTRRVLLRIVRTGSPLQEGEPKDFAPKAGEVLEVTVDRSRLTK